MTEVGEKTLRKQNNRTYRGKEEEMSRINITKDSFSPCPRCGSRKIELYFDQQLFSVYCEDCGLDTDGYFEPDDAVGDWNSFTPDNHFSDIGTE